MSKEPIQPGQAFHLPATQQANVDSLLKILGNKKATEALKELGKTDASTWGDIKESVSGLNDFVSAGGIGKILESFQETVDLQIADALSPFKNEINTLITEALSPLDDLLTDINNELSSFISDNQTGAAIGGIAGQIASMFLPGGPILIAVGALFGAAIQAFINSIGTLDPFKILDVAAEKFKGSNLGDRLEAMLDIMEEELRDPTIFSARIRAFAAQQNRFDGGGIQLF